MRSESKCGVDVKESEGRMVNTWQSTAFYNWVVFLWRYEPVREIRISYRPGEFDVWRTYCGGAIISAR